jgi:3-oxoacyl-[acyl-carrier protein] reductase
MVDAHYGRIVNIASNAYRGSASAPHYAAAKASLLGFTRSLAMEFGPDGITVNCVAPGFIDTPMTREWLPNWQEMSDQVVSSAPIRRLGQPDDVAAAVCFLAGEDAGYITGEVVHVTGGR